MSGACGLALRVCAEVGLQVAGGEEALHQFIYRWVTSALPSNFGVTQFRPRSGPITLARELALAY